MEIKNENTANMSREEIINTYKAFKEMMLLRKQARETQFNTATYVEDKVVHNSFLETRNNKDYRYSKSIHTLKPEGVGRWGYGIKPDIRKLKTGL